jgi:hypothetical protein
VTPLCVLCLRPVRRKRPPRGMDAARTGAPGCGRHRSDPITGIRIGPVRAKHREIPPISMRRAWFAIALSVASEKAGRMTGVERGVRHAQDRFLSRGGARPGFHAGSRRSSFFIGAPQHGQETTWGGFSGGGVAAAPTSSGRPVWKAMRSRFLCAAG